MSRQKNLTSGSGVVTGTAAYDAFGNEISATGSTINHYRYAGEQWDADLGLYYLRARYSDPQMGRFLNLDTFEGNQEDPLSLHKYLYAHADPVNNVDPSGNMTLSDVGAFASNVGNLAANVGIRAVPAITRATAIAFEATTGQTLLIGGAGTIAASQLRSLPGVVKGVGKAIVSGNGFEGRMEI